jgi:heme-degrading monooxygenase HmoA
MAAAAPFVAFSTMSEAVVPESEWPALYASLQAHKAHVQEYPGCQRMEVFAALDDDGAMRLHCYTTWDTPEQLEAFLERGYTFDRLLVDVGVPAAERSIVMEKLF